MKKTLIALAALGVVGAASAQNFSITGNVSMGLYTAADGKKTMTGQDIFNSNSMKLTASEDLGGGLTATGVLQQRFTGETMAETTGGDITIEVAGGFGSLKMGQFTFISGSGYNPFASTTAASVAPSGAVVGGKDTIAYTSPDFSGLTVALATTFDQTAGLGKPGIGVRVGYSAGPLSIQYGSTTAESNVAATAGAKLTSMMAKYDTGMGTVYVSSYDQVGGQDGNATTNPALQEKGVGIGASIPVGALTFKIGNMNRSSTSSSSTAKDRTSYGVDYALSKRTTAVIEIGADKAVVGGAKTNTSWIGVNHSF
jgi:predicted porin